MKAVVYKGPFEVAVEDVENPTIQHPNDVIVRVTSTAICGSDLHMYEGRTAAEPGITFGHENMGIIAEVGPGVTSLKEGDRVVMPFNVACGFCTNCVEGFTGYCLTVNPGFPGGAYGYVAMGPWKGGQAEYLRVPYADFNCLKLPHGHRAREGLRAPRGHLPHRVPRLRTRPGAPGRQRHRVRRRTGRSDGRLLGAAARRAEGVRGRPRRRAAAEGPGDRRHADQLRGGRPGRADPRPDRGHGHRQGHRRRRLPGLGGRRHRPRGAA